MSALLSSGRALPKRVRNELRFRQITVQSKQLIAGKFWRITFCGQQLAGYHSPGFDDHSKIFFPDPQTGALLLPEVGDEGIVWPDGERPVSRDYTPLYFDGKSSLTLDFYRHESGVASQWAEQATAGDQLAIGGPRGSMIIPVDYRVQVLVFDETGMPAVQRRLAETTAEQLFLLAFADQQLVNSYLPELPASSELTCFGGPAISPRTLELCRQKLGSLPLPEDDYFIWLTGEGESVKQLSDYLTEQRQCHPGLVRAVAYWHRKS
ncbi:siderophore-interacting protein [Tatumella punctata]|uniref:Siderophore-interacting protein n=1 Tax=Tatumella punctata TaxID=399969 RepID=A0ABW1VMF8_9GAMM